MSSGDYLIRWDICRTDDSVPDVGRWQVSTAGGRVLSEFSSESEALLSLAARGLKPGRTVRKDKFGAVWEIADLDAGEPFSFRDA